MTRWFRFYDDALNDPKILKLSDGLHRIWVGILCVASKNEGRLPPLDDLALMIRIKPAKMDAAIKSLIKSGLIDDDGVSLSPHNWNGRQYKSDVSTERVKRFRNGKRNVSVTPPDTEQTTEQIDAVAPRAALEIVQPTPEADYFRRVKEIVGPAGGGVGKKLLDAKGGSVPLARAAVEQASTKQDPREYLGAIIRNKDSPADEATARGRAW